MLKDEFQYFLDNRDKLINLYNGKYVVIKNQTVIASYDTKEMAYSESIKTNELGTFLIQYISEDESSFTQTYHSRVRFE